MIKIKQTCLPPTDEHCSHWSYGASHMRGISKATAAKLCGMYPLPQLGYETVVAIAPDGWGGHFKLYVQNISGTFFVASSQVPVVEWPEYFKVEVVGEVS